MTVDRKRKQKCEWCGEITNQYDGLHSEITNKTYCSDGCRDKAVRELQAKCTHPTAIDIRRYEKRKYGRCEECDAELVKENGGWIEE